MRSCDYKFALSLSRQRQCDKTLDSTTKRARERQCDRISTSLSRTFCRTVAISPTTVRQNARPYDNTGDSISMSLSLPFCRTVALSCVLSHYHSLSLARFVALSLSTSFCRTRQFDKMGEKATVQQEGRERQCDKTGERATESVTKCMRGGQCDKKWRDGDNECFVARDLSPVLSHCRSLVRFVVLSHVVRFVALSWVR